MESIFSKFGVFAIDACALCQCCSTHLTQKNNALHGGALDKHFLRDSFIIHNIRCLAARLDRDGVAKLPTVRHVSDAIRFLDRFAVPAQAHLQRAIFEPINVDADRFFALLACRLESVGAVKLRRNHHAKALERAETQLKNAPKANQFVARQLANAIVSVEEQRYQL